MLRMDSSVWPTRFFGLAKEHANKPRVVAAVDAESDIDVESSVPVVKSHTVSDSLRECGASHVSSSQNIPPAALVYLLLEPLSLGIPVKARCGLDETAGRIRMPSPKLGRQ